MGTSLTDGLIKSRDLEIKNTNIIVTCRNSSSLLVGLTLSIYFQCMYLTLAHLIGIAELLKLIYNWYLNETRK